MMAARAGAAHVYACESNPLLCDLATQIIAKNGYTDKITLIGKHSTAMVIGQDMSQKADVLVTEIFDNGLIGEGILPTLHHARTELLKDDARLIPQSASLHGQLMACPRLRAFQHADMVSGFDLSAMNLLAHPFTYKDAEIGFATDPDNMVLSAPFPLGTLDFHHPLGLTFEQTGTTEIAQTGTIDSVFFWFDLILAPDIVFSTEQVASHQHWRQVYQTLLEPVACTRGQTIRLNMHYDRFFDFEVTPVS